MLWPELLGVGRPPGELGVLLVQVVVVGAGVVGVGGSIVSSSAVGGLVRLVWRLVVWHVCTDPGHVVGATLGCDVHVCPQSGS